MARLTQSVLRITGSPGLARAALEFAAAQPQLMSVHKEFFLTLFIDKVLGAREPLPQSTPASYQLLATALTDAEVSEKLLPSIVRMSKRSPESVLGSAAAVFGMLRLDLSEHAEKLSRELLPLLRQSKDSVRYNTFRPVHINNLLDLASELHAARAPSQN